MKKNIVMALYSCILLNCITLARESDPFDAVIRQIDSQSKELNKNVIHTQQDGLTNQKIQRLELELSTIKADHAQEIAALKASHEEHIKTLKNEIASAIKLGTGQSEPVLTSENTVAQ